MFYKDIIEHADKDGLTAENAEKEQGIPYSLTGGIFLCDMGTSILPELNIQ